MGRVNLGNATSDVNTKTEKTEGGGTFKIKDGETRFMYLCPPHEEKEDGLPWKEYLTHNRDVPPGTNLPFSVNCLRQEFNDNKTKCPACDNFFEAHKQNNKKAKDKYKIKPIRISQVLDLTEMFDDSGTVVNEMPDCFLLHDKEEKKCKKCPLSGSCEKSVLMYYYKKGVYESVKLGFKLYKDYTDYESAHPIMITRTGKGRYDTSYTANVLPTSFEFPEEVIERIEERLVNLDTFVQKGRPEGTYEEVSKLYDDFFNVRDSRVVEPEEDEGDTVEDVWGADDIPDSWEEPEKPDCFEKYRPVLKEDRGCVDCDHKVECVASTKKKIAEKKAKDSVGDLRKDLKKDAKKGRMNKGE